MDWLNFIKIPFFTSQLFLEVILLHILVERLLKSCFFGAGSSVSLSHHHHGRNFVPWICDTQVCHVWLKIDAVLFMTKWRNFLRFHIDSR